MRHLANQSQISVMVWYLRQTKDVGVRYVSLLECLIVASLLMSKPNPSSDYTLDLWHEAFANWRQTLKKPSFTTRTPKAYHKL